MKVPVILVGVGPQGIGHGRWWPRAGARVTAVVDAEPTRAAEAARLLRARSCQSLRDALERVARPCIVDIVTPPATHLPLIVEALTGGAHVLVEKPVVMNPREVDTLRSAMRPGLMVCAMHNWLFEPPMLRALQWLERGDLGDLLHVHIAIVNGPDEPMLRTKGHWVHALPGGRVGETLPHACYLLARLFPAIEVKAARLSKVLPYDWSPYDTLVAHLDGGNATASLFITFAAARESILIDFVGTRGQCRIYLLEGFVERTYLRSAALGPTKRERLATVLGQVTERAVATVTGGWEYVSKRWVPGHLWIMRSMVRAISGEGKAPVSLSEIERTVEMTDLVVRVGTAPRRQLPLRPRE